MDNTLKVLKLIFEALEIEFPTKTLENHSLMQKSLYLVQRMGVDLGYRFKWYESGPFSPVFEDDHLQFIGNKEKTLELLHPQVKDKLDLVKKLLKPCGELSKREWAQLVASLDYLVKVDGYNFKAAKEIIVKQMPTIAIEAEKA